LEIEDSLYALTAFHTLFNLLGVLLFLPFVNPLAHFLEQRFEQPEVSANAYLDQVTPQVPEAALAALRKEVFRLISLAIYLNLKALKLTQGDLKKGVQVHGQPLPKTLQRSYAEGYRFIKQLEGEMLKFYTEIQKKTLEDDESQQLHHLIQTIHNTMHSVKGMKDIENDLSDFENTGKKYYLKLTDDFKNAAGQLYGDILEVLLPQNKTLSLEELSGWRIFIQQCYDKLLHHIYQSVDKKVLDEIEISTILNVNRELYSSHKAMILAVNELMVPSLSGYFEESIAVPPADTKQ
jgi:phosphate:Na+ symporter